MRPILAITEISLTDEEGWLIRFGKVVDVGEAQRYDRGFSDPTQSVPQEHVDPHVGTRLPGAGFMKTQSDHHFNHRSVAQAFLIKYKWINATFLPPCCHSLLHFVSFVFIMP